jgi:hypothetical protein
LVEKLEKQLRHGSTLEFEKHRALIIYTRGCRVIDAQSHQAFKADNFRESYKSQCQNGPSPSLGS